MKYPQTIHLQSIYEYPFKYVQEMTDVKLLLLHSNTWKYLTVRLNWIIVIRKQYLEPFSVRQWSGRPGFNLRSHHTKDF